VAADTDRSGRSTSGRVVNNAVADTTALASYTDTPAGQRALIAALRARLVHQQQVVSAYKRRDAAMASLLRSMTYSSTAASGARIPSPAAGFSLPASRTAMSRPSLSATGGLRQPRPTRQEGDEDTVLAARADPRAASVPAGSGGEAAAAALTQRGKPYVWGAKGPNSFDCSGLTQWAWAHAGVRLGPDTYSQVQQGVPVAPGDVRAGDLIFPKSSFDSRGPGHVQLAISPTEVVHAPESGDVVRVVPMPGSFVARRPVAVSSTAEN
jgi:cell wall-associated NlpC family hydrolase